MATFLQQIANYYMTHVPAERLCDYTFVFPNRRSGQFFERELLALASTTMVMPQVTSMIEWLGSITRSVPVTSVESIFLLYRAYRDIMHERAESMERFVFWAGIIINDFNDVDRNLVDARDLYTNLGQVRDIRTDYLTEELKEDIRRIFNIDIKQAREETERFWKHYDAHTGQLTNKAEDEVATRFYSLWQALADIYDRFHALLQERNLTSPGMMYRQAAQVVKEMAPSGELNRHHYVMVGFDELSVSELEIFKALQRKKLGQFWWDTASPLAAHPMPWSEMMKQMETMFPAPTALDVITTSPSFTQLAVTGTMAQAKGAFHEVDRMIADGIIDDPSNAIDTAIVLPDESLLIPIINSITPQVHPVNITLGVPLQRSSIVSLMHLVARLHHQATHRKRDNEWLYYREDVRDLLSHPIIRSLCATEAERLNTHITLNNLFSVPLSLIEQYPDLLTLFMPVTSTSWLQDVIDHIDRLIAFSLRVDAHERQAVAERTDRDLDEATDVVPLQSAFIMQYVNALQQLKQVFTKHADIFTSLADETIFFLIDRLTASQTIPFTGEPLQGLQIMGVLETRCLDFSNLIVLSMNDRTYPGRRAVSSFIPDYMRADKRMPTTATREVVNAYHFYRMISRTSHVTFIYNSSTARMGANEPSRYIAQLEKVYGIVPTMRSLDTPITPPAQLTLNVPKGNDMERFAVDAPPVGDRLRRLSASAINQYIGCPLHFYFHYIQDLNDDNKPSDFMDSAQFGTIVHNTLQDLYYPQGKIVNVYATDIDRFIKNRLESTARGEINKVYLHRDADTPLTGEALLMLDSIETYVRYVLDHDKRLLGSNPDNHIMIVECEKSHEVALNAGEGREVRFTFKADRIDRIVTDGTAGPLRIIDYKTGKDETSFSSIGDLFSEPDSGNGRPKAVLQLLLYCMAYRLDNPDFTGPIEPHIYKVAEMASSGVIMKKRGQYVNGAAEFEQEDSAFAAQLQALLATMCAPQEPWRQCSTKSSHCRHCNFTDFCRR